MPRPIPSLEFVASFVSNTLWLLVHFGASKKRRREEEKVEFADGEVEREY